jgi:hypothetical protein
MIYVVVLTSLDVAFEHSFRGFLSNYAGADGAENLSRRLEKIPSRIFASGA